MDLGRKIAELENRIGRVENQARLSHASLDNTSLTVTDGAGQVRGRIGMQEDGTIGLIAVDGPPPGAPTPAVVTASIGGLRIVWDGALADGSALPADFDHIAVHASTSSGFTPSAATFVGTITRSGDGGMLPVTPLPYQAHYIVLIAVNSSGIGGPPSSEVAATPSQVTGPDLTAGSVTAAAIQAGAVTAEKLEAILQLATRVVAGDPAGARVELNEDGLRVYNATDELVIRFDSADGSGVFTGEITGSTVTGGLITGAMLQTAASGQRITLNEADQNEILVYNASGTVIGELSDEGLLVAGSNGSVLWLDPNNTYPNLRMTNAARTNSAVINVVEVVAGSADLGMNSGTFTASGFTDMKWRNFFGNDFYVAERVRNSNTNTRIGGRISMLPGSGSFGYADTTGGTTPADVFVTPGVVRARGRTIVDPNVGDTNAVLFVQPATGHTGPMLRVWDPDAGAYRLVVEKNGDTAVDGILTAGNIAAGRITITPSAANTPTSGIVSGLNLKGSNIRVVATASTVVPGTAVTGVSVTGQSSTGFTVWLTRTNTTATPIDWIAYAV